MKLQDVYKTYEEDADAVVDFCNELYDINFADYFKTSRELFNRLDSREKPITDDELSWIVVDLPRKLFDVAEVLNTFTVRLTAIKLKVKEKRSQLIKAATEKSVTAKQDAAVIQTIDDELLINAYESIIERVGRELSYSRELIMGAKKIWDRRSKSEGMNPIGEVDPQNMPAYNPNKMPRKDYIYG